MMITGLVLLLASVFLVFLARLIRRRRLENDPTALYQQLQPVSVPALLNLLNPDDLHFLQANLRPVDFVKLKRQRTRSLIDYVRRIASNARVLTSLGAISQHSAVPEVVAAGKSLSSRALVTRILAFRTLVCLMLELLFPFMHPNLSDMISAYEVATSRLEEIWTAALSPR